MEADEDGDGKLSFDEFARTVANTVCVLFFFFFRYLGCFDKGTTCPCQDMLACIVFVVCVSPYSMFITDVSRILTPLLRIL